MNDPLPALSGRLTIDCIALPGGGVIGMCNCPGRSGADGRGRIWERDLAEDVASIRDAGFGCVLSLLGDQELKALGAGSLEASLGDIGLAWRQFPIPDFGTPDPKARSAWHTMQGEMLARLATGERLLVHCAAGLGRTGTIAAVLLKAAGFDSVNAVSMVRAARPGTIETAEQLAFVVGFDPGAQDRQSA